jgi:hypothetical protein
MEQLLAGVPPDNFMLAKNVYEFGAFSKSYAEVILNSALVKPIKNGTPIMGVGVDGRTVTGTAMGNWNRGGRMIHIQYDTSSDQMVRYQQRLDTWMLLNSFFPLFLVWRLIF